jgi:superfamily II DNA or RNA helicase
MHYLLTHPDDGWLPGERPWEETVADASETGNDRQGADPRDGTVLTGFLDRMGLDGSQVFVGSQLPRPHGRIPGMPQPTVPQWEHRLQEILDELAKQQVPGPRPALALRFSVEPPKPSRWNPDPTPVVSIQVMRRGKRENWIKSGASWTAMSQPWNEAKFVPEHFQALSRVAEALRAHGSEPVSSYQFSEASPQLWSALLEARRAGVEFLADGMASAVEMTTTPVQVALGVDGSGEDATAMLGVAWHGYTCAGAAVAPIGRKAFAVMLLPSEATDDVLVLARLASPLSERLTAVLGFGQEITVPAADRDRFAGEVLPRIAPHVPVASDDPEFHQEPPEPPILVATVKWEEHGRVALGFAFRYLREHGQLDLPVDGGNASGVVRDPQHERMLLSSWEHGPVARELIRFQGDVPAASMIYAGMDAVRVVTDLLPELRGVMEVEVNDNVPDLHELDGDPDISFDLVDSGTDSRLGRRRRAPGPDDEQGKEERPDEESDDIDWLDLRVVITVDGEKVPLPKILTALTRKQDVLVLDSGAVLSLDHPAFQRLKELVEAAETSGMSAKNADTVRIGTSDAALLEEASGLGVLSEEAERWATASRDLNPGGALPQVEAKGVLTPLRGYQQHGLNWMHHLYEHGLGGILADDMGLGKTLQTLALISTVKGQRRPGATDGPFLVVAPTSVVPTWKEQAARHTPGLRVETITSTSKRRKMSIADLAVDADIVVTSYTLVRQEVDDYEDLAWKGLILDESQAIKNPSSKTFHAIRRIRTDFALAVTGTPFENRLTELWPPLSIVAPGLYPALDTFKVHVANPVEKNDDAKALARMRQRIGPYILRRSKSLVANDLPEKQEEVLTVALEKKHQKFYDTLLQHERQSVLGLVEDFDRNKVAIFAALTRMRVAALDAGLAGGPEDVPSAKLTTLITKLNELADEGHRALVFSQFTSYMKIIRQELEAAGLDCVYLDGSTRDRGKVLASFREGKAPVFLISLKAGGTGLTLTEADYVFVMDPWWNPAVEAQAVDRAHRIGQTKQVMVYRMVSEGTIEEKVMALKERKAALFDQVIGDGSALETSFITDDDIRGLMD